MNKSELLKNRLQASIDFAVKMNEDLDSVSWNYQEGILLSCNEAKLVIELINKLTIPRVVVPRGTLCDCVGECKSLEVTIDGCRWIGSKK